MSSNNIDLKRLRALIDHSLTLGDRTRRLSEAKLRHSSERKAIEQLIDQHERAPSYPSNRPKSASERPGPVDDLLRQLRAVRELENETAAAHKAASADAAPAHRLARAAARFAQEHFGRALPADILEFVEY